MDDFFHAGALTLDQLGRVEAEFSDATGFGLIGVDCWGVPFTPSYGFCEFCLEMRKDPIQRALCYSCDAHGGLQAAIEGKPCVYRCHAGLVDFAIPIMHRNGYIGAVVGGQVRVETGVDTPIQPHDDSWRERPGLVELYDNMRFTSVSRVLSATNVLVGALRSALGSGSAMTVALSEPLRLDGGDNPSDWYGSARQPAVLSAGVSSCEVCGAIEVDDQSDEPAGHSDDSVESVDDLRALRLALCEGDLPQATLALDAVLDDMFAAAAGRHIGNEQLVSIEDELTGLADRCGSTAHQAVQELVRRHRFKHSARLTRYTCRTYLESLLFVIVAEADKTQPSDPMTRLLNRIERNPIKDWGLHDIATSLGVSSGQASKRFKAWTGKSFVAYVRDKRIARAKLMLAYTDRPVMLIARELNYPPNYFTRVVKQATGCSPSQYRRRHAWGVTSIDE